MKTFNRNTLAAIALAPLAGAASAGIVTGTITADNHYALYTGGATNIAYIGGGETGTGGFNGAYNWSHAESFTFNAGRYIYIAAWSDDAVAQGLIGEFFLPNNQRLTTNNAVWQVFATGIDLDTGAPHPTAAHLQAQVALANAGDLWTTPGQYMNNTAQTNPWGKIAGIASDAHWIWATPPGNANVFVGAGDWDEYLVFRTQVPAPGAAAALAGLGILGFRRRR
ncbi:MAG: hypothetical protein IBJ10_10620 [Phycisphaerales bacterium]|nr:hypothetical protein [Phycisphaerales bacterium]